MSFNCTGLRNTKDLLIRLLEELEVMESRPSAIALQECWMSHDGMMGLKIAEYRPVAATEGMSTTAGTRRGSVYSWSTSTL